MPSFETDGVNFPPLDDTNHDYLSTDRVLNETEYNYTIIALINPKDDDKYVIFGQSNTSDGNFNHSFQNSNRSF